MRPASGYPSQRCLRPRTRSCSVLCHLRKDLSISSPDFSAARRELTAASRTVLPLTLANLATKDLLKDLKEKGLELPRVYNLLYNYSVPLSGVMCHPVEEFCGRGPAVFPTFGHWNLLVSPHENGTVVNGHHIGSVYTGGNEKLKGSLDLSLGSLVDPPSCGVATKFLYPIVP